MKNNHICSLLISSFAFLQINYAQNVGIGITNPVFKLDVRNGSINTDSVYRIDSITILAVPGTGNLFVGKNAGRLNIGINNTFNGNQAGYANTTGYENSFFGQNSGVSNTTGYYNSFFGQNNGVYNTSGHNNSFFGQYSGYFNNTGFGNSFFGQGTGLSNTLGYENSLFGQSAGFSNNTGNANSFFGKNAGFDNTTGSNNTAVGFNADVSETLTNATAIGAHSEVAVSNALVLGGTETFAVNVGIGTTTPDASSALDINSTTRGFLPPRTTKVQRNSIVNPVAGLMVWCSNCGLSGQLQVYNGTNWTDMVGSPPADLSIGDNYEGGKVAYILQPGDPGYIPGEIHGLIAALVDQSTSIEWGCYGLNIPGSNGTAIGTGNQNTIDIVNECSTYNIAARLCYNLILEGYSDWYLASKDELSMLYLHRVAIGGFTNGYYWSSSEAGFFNAWAQFFDNGAQGTEDKTYYFYVRAVRSF